MLAFANGEFYVGQAVDVAIRFSAHARTYSDIVEVFFWRAPRRDLDRVEQGEIQRLQRAGLLLRNVVHASGRLGTSPFDALVLPTEQEQWLTAVPTDTIGEERRPDDPDVRRRGQNKYRQLAADPRLGALLPALHRYLAWTVPYPRRTELTYWAISAMPDTGSGRYRRLLTLSVQQVETLFILPKTPTDRIDVRVNVDLPTLLARWDSLDILMDSHPGVYAYIADYDARPDIAGLMVRSPRQLLRLLEVDTMVTAARRLNLDLMRKGPTIHWRTHSFALVDDILAAEGADLLDYGSSDDGVGATLVDRAADARSVGDDDTAEQLLRRAAAAGYADALVELGILYDELGRHEEAEQWLLKSVEAGEVGGLCTLGLLHEDRGDLDGAARWYLRAADAGNPFGMTALGVVYDIRGEVGDAMAWYRRAAKVGDGRAMAMLGEHFRVDGDVERAKQMFAKAVAAGYQGWPLP